jgi:predicted ATPase
MEQTIGWSYDLLDERHRALFRRLAAFPGGWSLEAAEAVGTGSGGREGEVLGLLSTLVEQSLVTAEPGDEVRYRLLEPVRQYAWELLEEGGEAEETREWHAAFYVELAQTAEPELKGPDQVAWLARLEAEHDNLRAAMGWLLARGDMATAASFGYSLWLHWWMRGHFSEGRNWMAAVAAPSAGAPASTRAWALLTASVMAYGQGDYEWAAPAIDECLDLFTAGGDDRGARIALGMAGLTAISLKEYERGAALVEEAVGRNLAAGDAWTAAMLRTYSAAIPLSRGEHAHAARLSEEALALARQLGDRVGVYVSLFGLATVARARNEHTRAAGLLAEALTLSAEMGDRGNVAYCLEALAGIAADRGHPACAASMWAAAEALLETSEPAVYVHTPDRSAQARGGRRPSPLGRGDVERPLVGGADDAARGRCCRGIGLRDRAGRGTTLHGIGCGARTDAAGGLEHA